ncbi:MAG TPA: N-acetyltransferase [Alphaproteobacteria bacterium]|nr:N-acetyltransferase [Alphaproteobacteria bacterium]
MTLAVSAAGFAQLELLAALHAAAFDDPWSAVALGELLIKPGNFALVAEETLARDRAAQALGFIFARAGGGECEILTLAVLPAMRRRKIATALLAAVFAEAAARGAAAIFLEVAADNHGAIALYAQQGFAVVGRRAAYYQRASGGCRDALVMRRPTSHATI